MDLTCRMVMLRIDGKQDWVPATAGSCAFTCLSPCRHSAAIGDTTDLCLLLASCHLAIFLSLEYHNKDFNEIEATVMQAPVEWSRALQLTPALD